MLGTQPGGAEPPPAPRAAPLCGHNPLPWGLHPSLQGRRCPHALGTATVARSPWTPRPREFCSCPSPVCHPCWPYKDRGSLASPPSGCHPSRLCAGTVPKRALQEAHGSCAGSKGGKRGADTPSPCRASAAISQKPPGGGTGGEISAVLGPRCASPQGSVLPWARRRGWP